MAWSLISVLRERGRIQTNGNGICFSTFESEEELYLHFLEVLTCVGHVGMGLYLAKRIRETRRLSTGGSLSQAKVGQVMNI